ncbi:hypothetical protein PUNSTDRAFT_86760 [Punctularia strigosozonata HHB-11173 SS5]|uniref:uncharacterized protein n=1 Tax=Punctularia strigosozonata (strain HHB-11173) TaxID=741275 RepID=UPI00044170DF|nr:uncharacterized protein PUNSTDRAFT_86760 [Punctularia strigosozonata HHB-11173 SS5]EIN08737.1 hypothetical protein PUNSTDRAFT_86760 [Punctularia strigosozonata HHB-11173 SS5]
MASSLSPECTPLKQSYDACFNAWFEGYLEPAVAASATSNASGKNDAYSDWTKKKTAEYEEKCGKVWQSYRECISKAVSDRGLDEMLAQARKENPLIQSSSSSQTRS